MYNACMYIHYTSGHSHCYSRSIVNVTLKYIIIIQAAVKEELEELQSQSQRQASQLKNCQQVRQ